MGDDDERGAGAAGEAGEERRDPGPARGVEARRRLVGDDDPRAPEEGPGDRDPLHLAAGEGADAAAAGVDPHLGEERRGPRRERRRQAQVAEARGQEHVLDRAQAGKEVKVLHDEPDVPRPPPVAPRLGKAGDVLAVPPDGAGGRRSSPVTTLMKVLLPAPDGPVTARLSPEATSSRGRSSAGAARSG
ncbi:MAG TPA: hypothetical protein VM422_04860 [Amaricoccus sp.]|nr:hypothetical protein [Amaricoccus sp.]